MKKKTILSKYSQHEFNRGRNNVFIIIWWLVQGSLFRYSFHNMYKYRAFLLEIFGCKIGSNVKIRPTAKFHYPWRISIGDNSWIGDGAWLYSLDEIEIGHDCVVSQFSKLCTGSHDIESESFKLVTKPIVIRDYAWIASDVFVGQGVTVGTGSVIAARSSIYKDANPWMVYAGNPAKIIKERVISKE